MQLHNKDIIELEKNAVMWWPEHLKKEAARVSVIPLLLDSQEDFIAILRLCDKSPLQVFEVIEAAKFPANLFLKHLTILADYGGETIQRLNKNFRSVFTFDNGEKPYMDATFQDKKFRYVFESLPIKGTLNNKRMGVDDSSITSNTSLTPIIRDMIMLLLYGSSALNAVGADLLKCEISNLLGKSDELDKYVRKKYIWVSRITGGATSNTQGQLAQTVVCNFLTKHLDKGFKIIRNGSIKLKGYSKPMPFDIAVERNGKYLGIEVSFQVTTNSVIERKSGQAQDRQKIMHEMGYHIAYVIDGAGNFQRRSAISTICKFSDCTVAYNDTEFLVLVGFIKKCLL